MVLHDCFVLIILIFFHRFEKELSLWGPFLSAVNGEQARQSDRRYWHLSSDGTALSQGENTQALNITV